MMKMIVTLCATVSVILLCIILALALSHLNNSLPNSNQTAKHGIQLLTPTEPWNFGRGEVITLNF